MEGGPKEKCDAVGKRKIFDRIVAVKLSRLGDQPRSQGEKSLSHETGGSPPHCERKQGD